MNLGYDIAQALPAMRAQAVSRMTETVTVGRYTDGVDETTGKPTRVISTSRYTGKARIKYPYLSVTVLSEPAMVSALQKPYLSVPTGTVLVDGDEVSVTASTVDSTLVGRRYVIEGAPQAGQTTSARYPLKEVS